LRHAGASDQRIGVPGNVPSVRPGTESPAAVERLSSTWLRSQGVRSRVLTDRWRRKLGPDSPLRAKLEHGFFSPERMVQIFAGCDATLTSILAKRFDFGLTACSSGSLRHAGSLDHSAK